MLRLKRKRDTSAEDLLALHLGLAGIAYEREVVFAPPRKWRADFLIHVPNSDRTVLVEVEGSGAGSVGRHQRFAGWVADMDKYNAATLLGYHLLRYTRGHVQTGAALRGVEDFFSMVRVLSR